MVSTEIGDTTKVDFYPQLKCSKWGNEVNLSLRLDESLVGSTHVTGEVDKFIKSNLECHFYAVSEGYEFGILLKTRPPNNWLTFTVESKNCIIYEQPVIKAADGYRPDNVVNSLAVYGYKAGGKYQTGKFCHIYRPWGEDSKGARYWCDLAYNAGEVTLLIPDELLTTGVYPILIDPTFGYTSVPGTALTTKKKMWSSSGTSGGTAGTGNSIIAYLDGSGGAQTGAGLYTDSSGPDTLVTNGCAGTQTPTSAGWYTHTFGTAPTIAASTTYWIAVGGQNVGTSNVYYDSAADGYYYNNIDIVASGCPSTFSKDTYYGSRRFGFYVDYTEAGGGGTSTDLLDGKIVISSATTSLFDGKVVVLDDDTDLLDGKVTIGDVDTDLLDGKVSVQNDDTDLLDGKVVVLNVDTDLLDGKVVIGNDDTDLLDGKVIVLSKDTDLLDGKVVIEATGLATDLLDGKINIKDVDTDLLDGKVIIATISTPVFDGKVVIKDATVDLLDGKIVVQDATTDLMDGKVAVQDVDTDLLDGKVVVKDSDTDLLDGKVAVQDVTVDLLDGKVKIQDVATNLLDGKVLVMFSATDLMDGKVVIKDTATDLLDGKVIVSGGVEASSGTRYVLNVSGGGTRYVLNVSEGGTRSEGGGHT